MNFAQRSATDSLDSVWEVYSPAINVGDSNTPVARFHTEEEAESVCEESRRRGIGYDGWDKRELKVVKSPSQFWADRDMDRVRSATSKLTKEEKELLMPVDPKLAEQWD